MMPSEVGSALWALKGRIRMKELEIRELRSLVTGTAVSMDGDRVQASGTGDRQADIMCDVLEAETELEGLKATYSKMVREINRLISRVSDERCRVDLSYRMIGRYGSAATAEEMSRLTGMAISDRQERRIYSKACSDLNSTGWDGFRWLESTVEQVAGESESCP